MISYKPPLLNIIINGFDAPINYIYLGAQFIHRLVSLLQRSWEWFYVHCEIFTPVIRYCDIICCSPFSAQGRIDGFIALPICSSISTRYSGSRGPPLLVLIMRSSQIPFSCDLIFLVQHASWFPVFVLGWSCFSSDFLFFAT